MLEWLEWLQWLEWLRWDCQGLTIKWELVRGFNLWYLCFLNGNVFGNEGNVCNCICGVCICGICELNARAVCATVVVVVSAANTRIAGPTIIFIISYHVLIPLTMNKSLISINLTCLRFCLQ